VSYVPMWLKNKKNYVSYVPMWLKKLEQNRHSLVSTSF
jgi:hypothetical protein